MIDIHVINLIESVDRREQIKKDFKMYTSINLIFVQAVKHENGAIGCMLSHKKCVQLAKDSNLPYVIIAEDDCLPMENFENRLMNILEHLKTSTDWKLFMGGVKKSNRISFKVKFEKEKLYGIKRGNSSHLCIFNSTIYDTILEIDETKHASDTFWHNKYCALITLPFLAYQRDGYSLIGKSYNGTLTDCYNQTQENLNNCIKNNSNLQ